MSATEAAAAEPAEKTETLGSFLLFCLKLVVLVLLFRTLVFSTFNIPSESMLPRLWNGDYLIAAKWPYGYSRYSLPWSMPLIPGRILAGQPERGDVVIFKAPPLQQEDYIKRVIGVPGDQVQMIRGVLYLNGDPVPKQRVADFAIPLSANTRCAYDGKTVGAECHYPRYRETLPGGRSYYVLDTADTPQDTTEAVVVPEGMLFLMGDNRDHSADSRFEATPGGGIGLVPQENLVGEAYFMLWSTDGSAEWLKPWTWFTAARWNRSGDKI
ncbi:MAG TPA: signal peptidase I [Croceibacterium sp.]|nr:signal peptidase I [Croceibacterium sp.]